MKILAAPKKCHGKPFFASANSLHTSLGSKSRYFFLHKILLKYLAVFSRTSDLCEFCEFFFSNHFLIFLYMYILIYDKLLNLISQWLIYFETVVQNSDFLVVSTLILLRFLQLKFSGLKIFKILITCQVFQNKSKIVAFSTEIHKKSFRSKSPILKKCPKDSLN